MEINDRDMISLRLLFKEERAEKWSYKYLLGGSESFHYTQGNLDIYICRTAKSTWYGKLYYIVYMHVNNILFNIPQHHQSEILSLLKFLEFNWSINAKSALNTIDKKVNTE